MQLNVVDPHTCRLAPPLPLFFNVIICLLTRSLSLAEPMSLFVLSSCLVLDVE